MKQEKFSPFMPPIGHRWRHHSRRSKNHEHNIAPAQHIKMCLTRCGIREAHVSIMELCDCRSLPLYRLAGSHLQ